jgi:hypothetical protein
MAQWYAKEYTSFASDINLMAEYPGGQPRFASQIYVVKAGMGTLSFSTKASNDPAWVITATDIPTGFLINSPIAWLLSGTNMTRVRVLWL